MIVDVQNYWMHDILILKNNSVKKFLIRMIVVLSFGLGVPVFSLGYRELVQYPLAPDLTSLFMYTECWSSL